MKITLFYLTMLFTSLSAIAQETHQLKHKLEYEMDSSGETPFKILHYIPEKSSHTDFSLISTPPSGGFTIIKGSQAINVGMADLEYNFVISDTYWGSAANKIYEQEVTLEPSINSTQETILGYTGRYFTVVIDNKESLELCIAEDHPVDNLSFVFSNQQGSNVRGLILAAAGPASAETGFTVEKIVLKQITPVDHTIRIDLEKQLASYQAKRDSLDAVYEREQAVYDSLYAAEYSAIEDAADAAYAAADAWDGTSKNDVYPYVSEYKALSEGNALAIESGECYMDKESPLWKGIPAYCQQLDTILPDFKNAELRAHARNYAGQLCDMYLYELSEYDVLFKATLDEIRKEVLYFNNIKDELSKGDKKLLDEFLNGLD
ncbi:hypothetical protein J2X69_001880 [Algoriphagus sp. 4150]|uniref:hypothetical protein n=1 Tax=Algoriphagus sp. 4150 TaxID=2817756 RepID=UPI0028611D24|nr:hypothetical protein [Algoriphagus sp. 4150]MDR7129535.1 hypothetical protein [Algoriphagus sp. 4150]